MENGSQLLKKLDTPDFTLPEMIFLDLNMPGKSGNECLKEIRSNEKFAAIPIAIYSTSASNHDIEETFRNGANVYIKKPSNFSTLKQLVDKAVSVALIYRNQSFNIENFLLKI